MRDCTEVARGDPWYMGDFCNKDQVVGASKDYCWLRKTRYLKLRNLVLFCVWEDAKPSLIKTIPLTCTSATRSWCPVLCHPVSSGCTIRDGWGGWLLTGVGCQEPASLLSSLRVRWWGAVMWWLDGDRSLVYWYGRQYFSFTSIAV